MAIKIFTIMQKNFLILLHSKLSSLIIILGPILLISLVGLGLGNTSIRDLNANVYIQEKSPFTDLFLDNLRARSFIIAESTSLDDCINSVKTSQKSLCIEIKKTDVTIPAEFNLSQEDFEKSGIGYSIHLYTDFSKQRVVWSIINKVQEAVNDFSSRIRSGASVQINSKLEDYSVKIKARRAQITNVISKLNDIEDRIPNLRSDLNALDTHNIINNLNNLDGAIKTLSQNNSDAVTQNVVITYSQLKDTLLTYLQNNNNNIDDALSEIDTFKNSLDSAKTELYSIDKELEDLNNDIDRTKNLDMNKVLNPIPLGYEAVSGNLSKNIGTELDFFDYLFPSFLSFFIIFISIILSTNFVIKERTSKAFIRNILSKTYGISFIIANLLTILFIVIIQCFIILILASFFLKIPIMANIYAIMFISIILSALFICLGMIIGYLFNSQETSMIASISISLLFIIFSPLISPIEILPDLFKFALQNTPLIIGEGFFRKILIFDIGLFTDPKSLIILFVTFVVLFILVNIIYRINRNKQLA